LRSIPQNVINAFIVLPKEKESEIFNRIKHFETGEEKKQEEDAGS
jgi:hypothetical protein